MCICNLWFHNMTTELERVTEECMFDSTYNFLFSDLLLDDICVFLFFPPLKYIYIYALLSPKIKGKKFTTYFFCQINK